MPSKINHHAIEASLRIGKSGITDNIIKQAIEQLKKKKVIKVKFLPSAVKNNKKELVKELAERARARIVHKVGFIVVLEKVK
jgi:RNA-binding protein YhbY